MSEKPSSLVHYTSLATLSSILNNAMESGILTFHLSHLYMMNDATFIAVLENLLDSVNDTKRDIETALIDVKRLALSKSRSGVDPTRQEEIVSSLSIGDFDSFELEDCPLSEEELAERKKRRESFDFTQGVD